MGISFVAGQMLSSDLQRNSDLAFNTNLLYLDVTGNRIGVNTNSPTVALQVVGNILANNITSSANTTSGNITITANAVVGNIFTDGYYYANGNPVDFQQAAGSNTQLQYNLNDNFGASANLTFNATTNILTVTGNINTGNVIANTSLISNNSISAVGAITGNTITASTLLQSNGNISAVGNIQAGNISAFGNVNALNLNAGGLSLTGNVLSPLNTIYDITSTANISTTANVNATTVYGLLVGNLTAGMANVSGNINAGNISVNNRISASTGYFTGNVDVLGNLNATIGVVYANSGIFYGNAVTGNNAAYAGVPGFTPLGSNVVMQFGGNVDSYSQLNFQNINNGTEASTDYIATASNGNDSANFIDMGIGSGTYSPVAYPAYGPNDGYLLNNGGNLLLNSQSAGKVIKFLVAGSANSNIVMTLANTGANVTGTISATGNIHGANFNTAGQVSATGNVTGGNIVTVGIATVFGTITSNTSFVAGNITIPALGNITVGNVNINNLADPTANSDAATKYYVDTQIVQNTNIANLTVSNTTISTSISNGNIYIAPPGAGEFVISSTSGFVVPVGTTAQRPNYPSYSNISTGTLRFNTTNVQLELWDGTQWVAASNEVSVVTAQTINPNGTDATYTLDKSTTASAILVTMNGLMQTPAVDYNVSGDQITFTSIPLQTDIVQVRFIANTTTVSAIVNGSGNAKVAVSETSANVLVTGNLALGTNAFFTNPSTITANITAPQGMNSMMIGPIYIPDGLTWTQPSDTATVIL